ncbi:hypothetical protein W97_00929 [Coniosporium apollinis CBS 100218]|uniref:Polycomb protein VEFS-Box domain-containing protein n=1 Tax=Coniosporium apollinis (strain CBS 100218) TaxID=1168221 RepID=R7YIK1_CONA1|nr:uncharacterized protein W97_00929 [Coniosporium apollinis CBS 100218]EON61713.1 hypothetical protein W97_00929 [Coniosporium apollinis CBS 100218]
MADGFKKFVGNACLYGFLDKYRNGTFLRRNVSKSLNRHQKLLESATSDELANGMQSGVDAESSWRFPSKDMLEKISKKQKPVLKIDVQGLRCKSKAQPKSKANDGEALVKTELVDVNNNSKLRCPCRVEITIWENGGEKSIIRRDFREAVLRAYPTESGETVFGLDLDEPFYVEVSRLFVTVDKGQHWKKTVTAEYTLDIKIHFTDIEDQDAVFCEMNKSSSACTHSDKLTPLAIKWKKLPRCPSEDEGLQVYRAFSKKEKIALNYELAVDMAWKTSKDTPLTVYNRALRTFRIRQLPSPISEPPSQPKQFSQVTYIFRDECLSKTRVLMRDDFFCFVCTQKHFETFEELHFHLKSHHHYFTFFVEKEEKKEPDAVVLLAKIEVEVSDQPENDRPSRNGLSERDIDWVAPEKPFDMGKYLGGDNSWVAPTTKSKRRVPVNRSESAPVPAPTLRLKRRRPEEVAELQPGKRKRFKVPQAPEGVRFFRRISKRPLEEKEWLSESDDNIDEGWLKLRRNRIISDSNCAEKKKAFTMRLDNYVQDEGLSGDAYAGDTLVRFVRAHRQWLKTSGMSEELHIKANELFDDGIISDKVRAWCGSFSAEPPNGGPTTVHDRTIPRSSYTSKSPCPHESNRSLELTPSRKRKWVPGGPGGGGRFLEVDTEEDGTKSRSPRTPKAKTHRQHVSKVPDGDTPMQHETPQQAGQRESELQELDALEPLQLDHCTCGHAVENMRTAASCANPVSYTCSVG